MMNKLEEFRDQMANVGYCPSCMTVNDDGVVRICNTCIERRDKSYNHSEEDVQEQLKREIDR